MCRSGSSCGSWGPDPDHDAGAAAATGRRRRRRTIAPGADMSTESMTPRQNSITAALRERLGLDGLTYPVPEYANSIGYLLGGITLAGFLILFVTGIYLAQFYHPHPAQPLHEPNPAQGAAACGRLGSLGDCGERRGRRRAACGSAPGVGEIVR